MLFQKLVAAACLGFELAALATPAQKKQDRKLKWFGINESGAEFGEKNFTGVYGREYIWYDAKTIDAFMAQGMNMFRLNFRAADTNGIAHQVMERLTPNSLAGPFDALYLGNLTEQINYITSRGGYAMVQPHNYGRFYGAVMTDTAGFQTWWHNVAAQYANNSLVVFDTNNEYHDMPQALVFALNQAAINGIRAAGALSQYITPEGNAWSGAWTWVSSGNGASLLALHDPSNKLIYQMHQYLDGDGSGTSPTCVSGTVLRERLQAATEWLTDNGKQGVIGEFAGGSNELCVAALKDGLAFLAENAGVWWGAVWWAAGPWWADYMFSMEPERGVAWVGVLPEIRGAFL
ncbi:glycoside hydrolase superfamily [Massariosphaeria phaeospora]|uniref:cellulase n=1 Tax=Massariosphaeria phaeospora TaxID=100035 RepID=A0A7C8MBX2_9PLEO|nr:glycoside hydrolase superfamily [Massariosphaeria phaeospora]